MNPPGQFQSLANFIPYADPLGSVRAMASPVPIGSRPDRPGQFPLFITISGIIGAGKSTLASALAERLSLPVFYEPVKDNSYLADFYGDIPKYAFPMQVWLLNQRFRQQQQIIWSKAGGVQDRSIYEDAIFAKMLVESGQMDPRDYETYTELFNNMSHFMQRPNIIVHLDVSPEESLRRIKLRSRDCESSISLEYLTALHAGYESFLGEISKVIPVIKVNYELFPSTEEMVDKITQEYQMISNVRQVFYNEAPKTHSEDATKVKNDEFTAVAPEEQKE